MWEAGCGAFGCSFLAMYFVVRVGLHVSFSDAEARCEKKKKYQRKIIIGKIAKIAKISKNKLLK